MPEEKFATSTFSNRCCEHSEHDYQVRRLSVKKKKWYGNTWVSVIVYWCYGCENILSEEEFNENL